MADIFYPEVRNSFMATGKIYFWTATINGWKHLMKEDSYKDLLIESLYYLSWAEVMDVFGFVIMPNHIHAIWRQNKLNGKESGKGSFLKYTAHEFRKRLLRDDLSKLIPYRVNASNKKFEFWQRDPLAIHLYNRQIAAQKLSYIHRNPLQQHWQLARTPSDYYYSSASFYEKGTSPFPFLKNLWDEY